MNSFPDGVYLPKKNVETKKDEETKCNKNLLIQGKEIYLKNNDGEYEYKWIKCPDDVKADGRDCYRRACNCDVEINPDTNQPVSIRDGWRCLTPVPLETFNTIFLSPSPMKYTVDKNIDSSELGAIMNQLEISFGEKFVSRNYGSSTENR